MQLRVGVVQDLQDVHVPVESLLVVQPADDVHFGAAVLDRLLAPRQNLLVAHHVALRLAQVGPKGTERAPIHAHVGRIQVRVDVVVGHVAVHPLADQIGQRPHFVQRHVRPKQEQPVVEREPLSGLHLRSDTVQRRRRTGQQLRHRQTPHVPHMLDFTATAATVECRELLTACPRQHAGSATRRGGVGSSDLTGPE